MVEPHRLIPSACARELLHGEVLRLGPRMQANGPDEAMLGEATRD